MSKRSVREVLDAAEDSCLTWDEAEGMADSEVYGRLFPDKAQAGPARDRRVAAREAGRAVQGDVVGAFRAALREGIDRPMHAVQKEGLVPETQRRRARGRDHGPHRPQRRLARDGRHEHAAGDGGKGAVA